VRGGALLVTDDALVIDCHANVLVPCPLILACASGRTASSSVRGACGEQVATTRGSSAGQARPCAPKAAAAPTRYLVARGRGRGGIHLMSARQSIMALVRYSMMLDANDRSTVRFGFELASRLVEQIGAPPRDTARCPRPPRDVQSTQHRDSVALDVNHRVIAADSSRRRQFYVWRIHSDSCQSRNSRRTQATHSVPLSQTISPTSLGAPGLRCRSE
jgi:hypothetical protein